MQNRLIPRFYSVFTLLCATAALLALPPGSANACCLPPSTDDSKASQTGESTNTQLQNVLTGLGNRISRMRRIRVERTLGSGASADGSIGDFSRLSAIALYDYAEGERDATERARGLTQHTRTGTLGFDYRISETLFAGANASFVAGDTDIDGNVASQDLDAHIASMHASKYWNNLFLDGLVSYGSQELDLERFDGTSSYTAETDGDQWSADLSLGYQYSQARWRVTPILKAFHLSGDLDGYRETDVGGSGSPEAVDQQNFDSTLLDLSVQGEYVMLANWGVVIPSFKLTFQHEFTDADRITGQNLPSGTGATGGSFSEKPDDPDSNTVTAQVGVSAQLQRGWSAFASYEHLLEHDYLDRYTFVVGVRYEIPEAYRAPHPNPGPRRAATSNR